MKDAHRLLTRLIESEGSLTAAMAKMGTGKTMSYWSKFRHQQGEISRDEYRLLRAAVPGGRAKRRNISVKPETYQALKEAKHPGMTWDEWLSQIAAAWEYAAWEDER
jgi:hypothetical protein